MGIILRHDDTLMVYEAVGPVKFTSISDWIDRDPGEHFVVKRLKNAENILTKENLEKLERVAACDAGGNARCEHHQRDGDHPDLWHERHRCLRHGDRAELVWKIYDRALGIEVGGLRKMKDFDLSSREVQMKLEERYPNGVPLEETVISPQDVFQSDALATVYSQ